MPTKSPRTFKELLKNDRSSAFEGIFRHKIAYDLKVTAANSASDFIRSGKMAAFCLRILIGNPSNPKWPIHSQIFIY